VAVRSFIVGAPFEFVDDPPPPPFASSSPTGRFNLLIAWLSRASTPGSGYSFRLLPRNLTARA